MKKMLIILTVGFVFLSSNAFAKCCCEAQIRTKAQAIDEELKSKNDANEKALNGLNAKIEELNDDILVNRTTEIKDGQLQGEMQKFNIMPKNLFHASSLPMGAIYYQLSRAESEKENLIASIGNQTDAILLNSKANLESLRNNIYSSEIKAKIQTDSVTDDIFNNKNK